MTQQKQIWKCEICGNIIEVLHEGTDSLVCCGQPMNLMSEQTQDPEKGEKHLPVIERPEEGKILIKVGSVPHPMGTRLPSLLCRSNVAGTVLCQRRRSMWFDAGCDSLNASHPVHRPALWDARLLAE